MMAAVRPYTATAELPRDDQRLFLVSLAPPGGCLERRLLLVGAGAGSGTTSAVSRTGGAVV